MNLTYATRLNSSMSQTTLNATVLAQMAELTAALDAGSKIDKVNLHPMARLYGSQLGTINGDRLGRADDGFGVPTEAINDRAVDAAATAAASIGDRAFATERGFPGTRGLLAGPKCGVLRGLATVTVADTSATGTLTVNWTSDAPPTVTEQKPAGWTAPLSKPRIYWSPKALGGSLWVKPAAPLSIAMGWVTATSDTGFTFKVHDYLWDAVLHTSSDYTTGARTFPFYWMAVFNHA